MKSFSWITMYITIKHKHTWGCPVYVLDDMLKKSNIPGLSKWYPLLHTIIYLVHLPFHSRLATLFFNQPTGHISRQYHVVFDDKSTTAPFMREGMIPLNWEDLVQ